MELLNRHKVGFLASCHTTPASVLPTLDWATEIRRNPDIAVISGFQSPLERQVLDILIQGRCGIILVLNRGIYRKVPSRYVDSLSKNRILFVSLEHNQVSMPSNKAAVRRNSWIAELADTLIFASVSATGSLFPLSQKYISKISMQF